MLENMSSAVRKAIPAGLATLACLYLPFAWLILMDYPWNGYRWLWITLLPMLPGFFAGAVFKEFFRLEWIGLYVAMPAVTLVLFILFTTVGSRGRQALWYSSIAALMTSLANSCLAYRAFWM